MSPRVLTYAPYSMPRLSYSKRSAIRQAIDMQKLCFAGAQLLDGDMRATSDKEERARVATALGNLVRNWSVLQESVRVLKGDPMPGSLRPKEKLKPHIPYRRSVIRRAAEMAGPTEP